MIETNLNEVIVNTILRSIPKNIKPVIYLMDLLKLSRESVYRRIRREISFSMEEITLLSLTLGFSIDEIIEGNKKERKFFDLQISSDFSETYIGLFKGYDNYLQNLLEAKKNRVLMALNHIPALFSTFFDNLSRFFYYKWITENVENASNYSFSNLHIPNDLFYLQEKIAINCKKIGNVVIIFSPHIFLSTIKDILYFYKRKFLTKDELQLLKNDVLDLIDLGERIAKNGYFNADSHVDFYLSTLNIHSNSVYIQYDSTIETHFWIYSSNPMIIRNSEVCEMQEKWICSIKKHSTLITESNEILQIEFFNKQRAYVHELLVEAQDKNFIMMYDKD
jgi:hypothetical protein